MSFERQPESALGNTHPKEQDPIAAHIASALRQAPIVPELRDGVTWNQEYANALLRVKASGIEHGICDHGWEHYMHVSKNVLLLRQITLDSVKRDDSRLAKTNDWETIVSPASLLYVVLKSDIHYGDPDVTVKNRGVPDHAKRSAATLARFREPSNGQSNEAHSIISQNYDMFHDALSFGLEDALAYANSLESQKEPITPQQLFPLLPKVADMFDLYRSSRVRHIDPESNQNNTYYQLSEAVRGYTVSADETTLKYGVQLTPNNFLLTSDGGAELVDFEKWYVDTHREVEGERNYADVWELARSYASLLNREFEVVDLGAQSFEPEQILSNLGAFTVSNY
jgi:hypothetical protein